VDGHGRERERERESLVNVSLWSRDDGVQQVPADQLDMDDGDADVVLN
jgi:hypothetical protein